MRKELQTNLDVASKALDVLRVALTHASDKELADIGGRLKGIAKASGDLRDGLGERVKKLLRNKEGEIVGDNFRAILTIVLSERIDTTALREKMPDIAARFTVEQKSTRLTFDPR